MKRLLSILAGMVLAASLTFAQDADDDFYIPLDEDLSTSATAETGTGGGTNDDGSSSGSPIKQGLWIEATNKTGFIIRDIATGKEKGYELDNDHNLAKMNWWFWGDFKSWFHIDAEVSIFDFDKTIYQANSYGANVPDVTLGDGFQELLALPFSVIKEGNPKTAGMFNKFGFNMVTPAIVARVGYGDLKNNGMSEFTGIYNVLDRWLNVGDGYTELKNGSLWAEFGNVKLDILAALSKMRGNYGTYDYIDLKYSDKFEFALTYGSYTTAEKLFYYFDNHKSAFTAYAKYNIIEGLSAELHGVESYTSDIKMGNDTGAIAARIAFANERLDISLMQGFAGKNANSVWGADGTAYDTLLAGNATTMLNLSVPSSFITFGLDEMATIGGFGDGGKDLWRFRTQPMIDFDLNESTGKDMGIKTYAVFNIDKLAEETCADRNTVFAFDGFGIEFEANNIGPKFRKLTFDYAAMFERKAWESGNTYDLEHMINSIMINADVTDNLNVHFGSLIRSNNTDDETYVPFGFSLGVSFKNLPLPGHPMLWIHFSYGMNPYEDNNYTLFRADDPINKPLHRTYMLNSTYKDYTKSEIGIGMIWDLK